MMKYLWLTSVVIVLDQASKWFMVSWLSLHDTIAVMPYFNLTMAHNPGAAFSFLAHADGWQKWFFIGLASIVSIALLIWLKRLKPHAKLEAVSIAMILGGALGNLIDRFNYGYVIDFLDFYYSTSHWPAFNIADSAIVVGAILLIFDSFRSKTEYL